jgi:hypothetical protein
LVGLKVTVQENGSVAFPNANHSPGFFLIIRNFRMNNFEV